MSAKTGRRKHPQRYRALYWLLRLTWGDVDWERGRLTVLSPKTEHHTGGESRTIPLFPELRPYLEEVFELAQPGTEYIITRYRDFNANLRTQLLQIIKRAGVKPWPKLFHNLRASRQTDLFPLARCLRVDR